MACNTPECGCTDCLETPPVSTPCTSCECNPGFCDEGCGDYPPTSCVIYNGADLPCTGISAGDTLNDVVKQLEDKYCNALGDDKFVRVSDSDTTSGYLTDKIDIDNSNVAISLINEGGDERLQFNYTEQFKVKTDGTDVENYLIHKIILKDDPFSILKVQDITNEGGKTALGYTVDVDAICKALTLSGCIPPPPSCGINVSGVQLTGFPGGTIHVNLGYTGGTPDLFEYILDDGQVIYNVKSFIDIPNVPVGLHAVSARAVCANGVKGLGARGTINVPAVEVVCPSVSLTSTDNSVAVAWSVLDKYTYTIQLSYSENGAAIQTGTSSTGTYIFTNLTSAVEYWVRVIPTTLGVTKSICIAQSILTTQQTCNAVVNTPTVTNANSDGTVTINWTGSGAATYEYRVGTAAAWIGTTASSVNLTAQSIGTHTFFIRAKCANGLYGTSAQTDFIIPAAICAATIDTVAITNPTEAGTATVSWTATGAVSYEYKIGLQGSWIPTTAQSASLNNLTAGNYTVYVRSKCANGLYGGQNQGTFTIPIPTCDVVVYGLIVTNAKSDGSATISWAATIGAQVFEYKVGLGNWIPTNQNVIPLTGIADGTVVQVRAKCTNGIYSNTVTATINIPAVVCTAPGTPTLSDVSTNTYNAEWTFTDSDPFALINAGTDNLSYPHSAAVALGGDLVAPYGAEGNNKFLVLRIQSIEQVKTVWFNTNFNNGTFPDSVFYAVLAKNGWWYYITRDTFVFDSTSYSITLKN